MQADQAALAGGATEPRSPRLGRTSLALLGLLAVLAIGSWLLLELVAAGGELLAPAKLVDLLSSVALVSVLVAVLVRLGAGVVLSLALAATVITTQVFLIAGTGIRPESMPTALQLGAVALVAFSPRRAAIALAAVLCAAAVLFKVSALWAPIAIAVWLIAYRRPGLLTFMALFAAGTAGLLVAFGIASDGRMFNNLLQPGGPVLSPVGVVKAPLKTGELLSQYAQSSFVLLPVALLGVFFATRRSRPSIFGTGLVVATGIILVLMADVGGDYNHLLDFVVLLPVVTFEIVRNLSNRLGDRMLVWSFLVVAVIVGTSTALVANAGRTLVTTLQLPGVSERSAPTPAPTQPTAKPTGASPFAAPVTTATYTVPASIDATGATDVSAALNAWIQGVPDGSVISFPAKGVYKLGKGIQLGNRHNLVFQGNGATLRASGAGSDLLSSLFVSGFSYPLRYWTGGTTHIAIRDFNLVGNDSTPGVYGSGGEGQAGFRSYATGYLEVSGCTISAVWGDGFFFHDSTNVWVHDNRVASAGRNGVTVISGSGVTAEGNKFDKIGYVTLDVEPNAATEASSDIVFRSNTAGTWGQDFVSVDGQHTGASIRNITVSGNTVTGGTLSTRINNGGGSRLRNIAVTDNTSRVAGRGPVLIFAHVDGLKVTGNVQPLTSGSLTSITDSTNVTYP